MSGISKSTPWIMLAIRTLLFIFFQACIAIIFYLSGADSPWHSSEPWWTFGVIFTNIVCIFLLIKLFRREGTSYLKEFRFVKDGWWKDLLICLGIFVLSAPISMLPNVWLSNFLFGSTEAAGAMFFQPLPLWALLVSILFPVTHVFAELPVYFGYAMPRLGRQLKNGWSAWIISSLFLALQHGALPFVPDQRFIIWRIGMFLPFALFAGLCIKLRPSLLPYMMIGHGLMDLMLVFMIPVVK